MTRQQTCRAVCEEMLREPVARGHERGRGWDGRRAGRARRWRCCGRLTDVRREVCAEPGDLGRVLDGLGERTLVVVGGDGSVHTAVATLLARGELSADRPLGLVPLGTGNDLARTLGIPLDPADGRAGAARPAGRGRSTWSSTTPAAWWSTPCTSGVGAEAAEKATALKDRLGRAAYAVGSVAAGAGATGWHLQVVVDGRLVRRRRRGADGGGGQRPHHRRRCAELAPDASPDDGLVDVVVATSTGPLARLGFAVALRDGEHVERDDVLVVRGRIGHRDRRPVPAQRRRRAGRPGVGADLDRAPGRLVAAACPAYIQRRIGLTAVSSARCGADRLRHRVEVDLDAAREVVVEVGRRGSPSGRGPARSARPPRRGRASGG